MNRWLLVFTLLVGSQTGHSAQYDLGMNVDYTSPWTTQFIFSDVIRHGMTLVPVDSAYNWRFDVEIPSDANGYPLQIPAMVNGESFTGAMALFNGLDGHYPSGDYSLRITGTGRIVISGDTVERAYVGPGEYQFTVNAASEGLYIELFESAQNDPVTQIQLHFPGYAPGSLFYQPFIDGLRNFKAIRAMNLLQINEHLCDDPAIKSSDASCVFSWANRVTVDYQSQSTEGRGMAWEHVVAIASAVGRDFWLNIPHAANDQYVRELATLFRDGFAQNIYLELSNEVWNLGTNFPQSLWMQNSGALEGLEADAFYVRRLFEIFTIFDEVFGNERGRLIKVLSSQQQFTARSSQLLELTLEQTLNPGGQAIDALAIGAYFGISRVTGSVPLPSEILSRSAATINEMVAISAQEARAELDRYYPAAILVGYEAGQHMTAMDQNWNYVNDPVIMANFIAANRDPGVYAMYQDLLSAWFENGGDILFMFSDVSYPEATGVFGHREYYEQPLAEAHKFRAVTDFIQTHADANAANKYKSWWWYPRVGDW